MKKFTNYLTMVMVLITSAGFAQTDPDAGVVSLPNFDPILPTAAYPNVPTVIEYERQNFGTQDITSSTVDSLTMEQWVDGVKRLTFYRNMAAPFKPGIANKESTQGVTPMDWGSLGLQPGNNALCVRSVLWKGGANIDVNQSNDEFCVIVAYSGDNNPLQWDLEIRNVTIEDFNGATITNGGHVGEDEGVNFVRFDVYNNGVTDLPAGVPLKFELSFNSSPQTPNFIYSLTQPMGAMATLAGLGLELPPAGIFPPASGGDDLTICVKMIENPDDINNSNDEGCSTFNSTLGIWDEVSDVEEEMEIKYYNRNLNIKLVDGMTGVVSINIIAVSGQVVQNTSFSADNNADYDIALDNLNAGVYIVNVKTEDNQVKSQRFIVD